MSGTLTGKTKHRLEQRMFSPPLMVLQVEVKTRGFHPLYGVGGQYYRDATVEDAIALAQMSNKGTPND